MNTDVILKAIQSFLNIGAAVMMPIIITILGLIVGQKFGKSFRGGLTVGIGLIGVFAVIGILANVFSPLSQALVTKYGLHLNALDMGWPTGASIAWAMPTAWLVIPLCIAFNALLIFIKQTKTINIDVWNFWGMAFTAGVVYIVTKSLWIGWAASLVQYFLFFKVGDWAAPLTQDPEIYNFPGIAWAWFTMPLAPIGIFLNKVIDHIPWLNTVEADPEAVQKKLGILGEAPILGLVLGLIMGVAAGYKVGAILTTGVTLAAVMLLLPRMIGIMMEGLVPLADSFQEYISKRFSGREFYIGLDGAISAGYVPLLATSMITVGLAPFIALILPGNQTIPMADLAIAWAIGMWGAAPSKGNIVRGTIIQLLLTVLCLYFATFMAPFMTAAAQMVGVDVQAGTMITSLTTAGMIWPIIFLIPALFLTGSPDIFGYSPISMVIFFFAFLVVYFGMWWVVRKEPVRIASMSREELKSQLTHKKSNTTTAA